MRRAYVSGITNDSFLPGVVAMFRSLASCCQDASIERLCFVTGNVSGAARSSIACEGVVPVAVEEISIDGLSGRWSTTFQKLSVFGFGDYDKLVWVDADMMVLDDLDGLFEWPHMSCVRSRAPMMGMDDRPENYSFNSGLMVIRPSAQEFESLCAMAPEVVERYRVAGVPVGDQNVLNAYYSSWPVEGDKHLPDGYNVFWGSIEDYFDRGYTVGTGTPTDIHVIHFTGAHKPWVRSRLFRVKTWVRALRHQHRLPDERAEGLMSLYSSYLGSK